MRWLIYENTVQAESETSFLLFTNMTQLVISCLFGMLPNYVSYSESQNS